jgi:hypothetical protein
MLMRIVDVLRLFCLCFCPFSPLFSDRSQVRESLGTYSES